jgi:hypothetical protein
VTNAIGCSGTSALLHCFYLEKRNVGIGNDSLLVFGPGEEILLPLIASPPLDNSRPYDLQFLLRYNDSRLAFAGITPFGQRQWWNLLETRIVTGGVWIHAAGPVTDSVRELFLVHFDQRGTGKESERFLFPVGSLSVTAPCIGRTSTVDPAVLIDGQCSRIAVAKSPHTTLTASPNPFNPTTDLRIRLVRAQNVTLDIFSLLGNRVARLYQGILPEGESTIRFTPTELSSGLYVARIRTDTDSRSCLLQYLK